jgi:hypothetical protein
MNILTIMHEIQSAFLGVTLQCRYFLQSPYKTKLKGDHLRIFGSLCYLHIPKESHSKLNSKTCRCFFLGYDEQSKAFRVYDPAHRKLHISRDIVFDEQTIGYSFIQQNTPLQIEPFKSQSNRTSRYTPKTEQSPTTNFRHSNSTD